MSTETRIFNYCKANQAELQGFCAHVIEEGYGVIRILKQRQVAELEKLLDADLLEWCGADYDKIINGTPEERAENLYRIGGNRKKSAMSEIFYTDPIFDVYISSHMKTIFDTLFELTYLSGTSNPLYEPPMRLTRDSVPFLDRYGMRLPSWITPITYPDGTVIGPERGLGMHLDTYPYRRSVDELKVWRPFQSFMTVTDHMMPDNGGIEVVPRFHTKFKTFFSQYARGVRQAETSYSHSGEFFRMGECEGTEGFETVNIRAPPGCVILWDSRLPHKTTAICSNPLGRKQIYGSWLPGCELNARFMELQREHFRAGVLPPQESDARKCYMSKRLKLNKFQQQWF